MRGKPWRLSPAEDIITNRTSLPEKMGNIKKRENRFSAAGRAPHNGAKSGFSGSYFPEGG